MHNVLKNDLATLELLLDKAKKEGLSFLNNLAQIPVSASYTGGGHPNLEEAGKGTLQVLEEFKERVLPIMVSSTGPRYWGFVTGGATPASIVGGWLTTVYDQNTQTLKGQGDISANIEWETIHLLLQLFELPEQFLGGFVTWATMSNFTCLAVARQWMGKALGTDVARQGVPPGIKIVTATAHSSSIKSLAMLGLGSQNIIKVEILPGNREAIDIASLEKVTLQLDGQPFILIFSGGTVNTVDYDVFEAIARLKTSTCSGGILMRLLGHLLPARSGTSTCSAAGNRPTALP